MTDHKGQPVMYWGGTPAPVLSAISRELRDARDAAEMAANLKEWTQRCPESCRCGFCLLGRVASNYLAAVAEVERLRANALVFLADLFPGTAATDPVFALGSVAMGLKADADRLRAALAEAYRWAAQVCRDKAEEIRKSSGFWSNGTSLDNVAPIIAAGPAKEGT